MIRNLKPLNVAPEIKAARWTFLFLGIIYGVSKVNLYKQLEKTQKPLREKKYHEQHVREAIEVRNKTIEELFLVGKDFEVTDFPPGWDDNI